jgi:hypothetical protein
MAGKNKDEFQSKYGAPKSPDAQVLIGMKSGRAVYGSELDATDTKGSNVINNTPSQNQAIMDQMFGQMAKSGGMYNPPTSAVAKTAPSSPEADAQFLKTLNKLNSRPDKTSVFAGTDYAPQTTAARANRTGINQSENTQSATTQPTASNTPITAQTTNPMVDILGGLPSAQEESPAFDVAGENANFLIGLNKKKSTPKQSNTEVVSVNGRDVPVHKAETMDYRPERDGVMLGVTTTSGQEPTIFGKTLGQMSPEERGLWTKKPEGIDFDGDGMLFGTAQKRSPEEEARIAKWEESELQNNPEVRGRRIKTYEEQLKGATTNDPEELRSKGYNPEGVAAAKKELERLRGMGKNTNATTKPKTQLPNPYQDRVDGLLAFGDSPANWGF